MRAYSVRSKISPTGWVVALTLLIVVAVVLAAYVWHSVGKVSGLTADKVPVLGPKALAVSPGIYLLGGLAPGAAYAVETSDGLVLIDSGLQDQASLLKSQLASLGLDWKRIRAVLLTHAHGDHCGGAEYLRELLQAKICAGEGDAAVLRAGAPREAFFSTFHMPDVNPHPTAVDVELKGGESIIFGNVRFRALFTPGHTPGSTCYLMERDNIRALFAGDVISMLRGDPESPSHELQPLGTYAAYLPPRYRGNARDYLWSLRQLRSLPVPDLVLPGHPRSEIEPQCPRLSQQAWEELLDQGIRTMETLVARFDADGAAFLDGNAKQLLPDLLYLGDFHGRAVYGLFASSKFFVVDAPGGPGLKRFVRDSLQRLGRQPVDPTAILLTSCGEEATAGLKDLLDQGDATVVCARAGIPAMQQGCPVGTIVLAAEDLAKRAWFTVTPMPLRGRGSAPIAYVLSWAGKTVLISGSIPVSITTETWADLIADISNPRVAAADYLISVNQLAPVEPNLWLPAVPSHGRNANLYDRDWEEIIAENYRAGHAALTSSQ